MFQHRQDPTFTELDIVIRNQYGTFSQSVINALISQLLTNGLPKEHEIFKKWFIRFCLAVLPAEAYQHRESNKPEVPLLEVLCFWLRYIKPLIEDTPETKPQAPEILDILRHHDQVMKLLLVHSDIDMCVEWLGKLNREAFGELPSIPEQTPTQIRVWEAMQNAIRHIPERLPRSLHRNVRNWYAYYWKDSEGISPISELIYAHLQAPFPEEVIHQKIATILEGAFSSETMERLNQLTALSPSYEHWQPILADDQVKYKRLAYPPERMIWWFLYLVGGSSVLLMGGGLLLSAPMGYWVMQSAVRLNSVVLLISLVMFGTVSFALQAYRIIWEQVTWGKYRDLWRGQPNHSYYN